MKILFPILIILFACSNTLFSQDTTEYVQCIECRSKNLLKKRLSFHNKYTLIKNHKNDKHGVFVHDCITDGFDFWYEEGTFIEEKNRFILTCDTIKSKCRIDVVENPETSDSLVIKCLNWWGRNLQLFSVAVEDEFGNDSTYYAKPNENYIKISKKELIGKTIYLCPNNIKSIYGRKCTGFDQLSFYYNTGDPILFNNTEILLRKNKRGVRALGFYNQKMFQFKKL